MEDHVNYWLCQSPYKDEDQYDNLPCTFVYVLYDLCIDEEVLNRIHEVLREKGHFVILCDDKSCIDKLMEHVPSMRECYPDANRIALEDAAPQEVIRRVFSSNELNVNLTPAAVDKVCRLLMEESKQRGLGSSKSYARQLSELSGLDPWNSENETVIDADDIDEGEFLA